MRLAEIRSWRDMQEKFIAIRVKKSQAVNPVPVNPISAGEETGSKASTTVSTVLRTAKDGTQTFGPGVAAVITPVPIAGPPLAAAISGLVAILQGIDTYEQNTEDLAALRLRLCRLSSHLWNTPNTSDPGEQMWRDSLASMLQKISTELMKLDNHNI